MTFLNRREVNCVTHSRRARCLPHFENDRAVSFAYAASTTETLVDVSIDTLEAFRRRGHAARAVSAIVADIKPTVELQSRARRRRTLAPFGLPQNWTLNKLRESGSFIADQWCQRRESDASSS